MSSTEEELAAFVAARLDELPETRTVDAMREIVNIYVLAKRRYDSRVTMRDLAEDRHQAGMVFGLLCAVQCIGVIWESHPGYRSEWKP